MSSKIDFSYKTYKSVPYLFATAGYRFLVNEDMNRTTALMVKYIQPLPNHPEVNFKL